MVNTSKKTVIAKPAVVAKAEEPEVNEAVQAWKESFKEANARDLQLSDAVILQIIERSQFQALEDDDAKLELFAQAETTAKAVMTVDPGITVLVSKMDDAFHAETAAIIAAVRKGKSSAVDYLAQFRRIYTKAELDGMAMPGSEADKGVKTVDIHGTVYRADKVKTKTPQGDDITTNWCNDFVSEMPEGKAAEADIELVAKEKANTGTTRLKSMSKDEIADVLSTATQDRNALRSVVRRAIKLHHRLSAIDKSNAISIRFIAGTKKAGVQMPTKYGLGEIDPRAVTIVTTGPKPLWLWNTDDPSKGRDFSVTQVLSMQPELAKMGEHGGNMADLIATAGQGSDEDSGEGEDGSKMQPDVAQATLSQFYNWANVRDNNAMVRTKIANSAKDADGKDWLQLVGLVYFWAKPIYEANKAAYENASLNDEPKAETKAA